MDYKRIFLKGATPTSIGGQAVMEGILMRSKEREALAVRLPDGEVYLRTKALPPQPAAMRIPLVRGVVSFFYSLVLGMRAITDSANVLEGAMSEAETETEGDEESPGGLEGWLNRRFGEKAAWNLMLALSVIIAIAIAVLGFVIFPTVAVNLLRHTTESSIALNLVEGLFRIFLFVCYILAISVMEDINRLFMYHGAEHKAIHCYENGLPLTVENARGFYTLHPRCGTSFLVFVLVISLLLFSFLGWPSLGWRIASRLLLLPVIAGLSYELLRWAGRSDNALIRALSYPGLLMQRLTTREPEDGQLEVAIVALQAVLGEETGVADHGTADAEESEAEATEPADAADTTEQEVSDFFKDLELRRYDTDEGLVRNIVREGRERLRAAGIENAAREADDIFCYVTGFSHTDIRTRDAELLAEADRLAYQQRIAQRVSGVPLQYITRVQEFMGLPFRLNEHVLIPRLDTEVLADQAIGLLRGREIAAPRILDLCTGSGILGITLAHEFPEAEVSLTDISPEALSVAMSNAQINHVFERCRFLTGSYFEAVGESEIYDIILSNPPYIPSAVLATLAPEVRDHEPRLALDGGADGLDAYRAIAEQAGRHLSGGGMLALEIGDDQAETVTLLLERTRQYDRIVTVQDLNRRDRVILAQRGQEVAR